MNIYTYMNMHETQNPINPHSLKWLKENMRGTKKKWKIPVVSCCVLSLPNGRRVAC